MSKDESNVPSLATAVADNPLSAQEAYAPYMDKPYPEEVQKAMNAYYGSKREVVKPNELVIEDGKPIPPKRGAGSGRKNAIIATLVSMEVGQSVWSKGLDERTYFYQIAAELGIKIRGQREGYGVRFWRIE